MTVCLVIEVPGATIEQYDGVMRRLEEGGGALGEGQTGHVAGPIDGGIMVIDAWESREHFDRFMQGRLGEAIQAEGVPQPQIREFPIHNQVLASS